MIVAVDESELSALSDLQQRATLNKVPDIVMLDQHQIKEIEPHCKVRKVYTWHMAHLAHDTLHMALLAHCILGTSGT